MKGILSSDLYFRQLGPSLRIAWCCDTFPPSFTHIKTHKKILSFENQGFVAFAEFLGTWVVAAEPVTFQEDISKKYLLQSFYEEARKRKKRVCGYYLRKEIVPEQFSCFRLGVSHLISVQDFHLYGKKFTEVRRALNQGARSELFFSEVKSAQKSRWLNKITDMHDHWLRSKKQPEVKFLLSRPREDFFYSSKERWFVVSRGCELEAFISLVPYGKKSWYLDSSLQSPGGHKFALDFLLAKTCLLLQEEKVLEFCMGLNAFCISKPKGFVEKVVAFGKRFPWPYKSSGLYFFKSKFTGQEIERFFFIEKKRGFLVQVFAMFWVTFVQRNIKKASKS